MPFDGYNENGYFDPVQGEVQPTNQPNPILEYMKNTKGYQDLMRAVPFTDQWTQSQMQSVNRPWKEKLAEAITGALQGAGPLRGNLAPQPPISGGISGPSGLAGASNNDIGMSSIGMMTQNPIKAASNPMGGFGPPPPEYTGMAPQNAFNYAPYKAQVGDAANANSPSSNIPLGSLKPASSPINMFNDKYWGYDNNNRPELSPYEKAIQEQKLRQARDILDKQLMVFDENYNGPPPEFDRGKPVDFSEYLNSKNKSAPDPMSEVLSKLFSTTPEESAAIRAQADKAKGALADFKDKMGKPLTEQEKFAKAIRDQKKKDDEKDK